MSQTRESAVDRPGDYVPLAIPKSSLRDAALPVSSTIYCSIVTASFNGEERFDWTAPAGFRVLIPDALKFEAFARASLADLRGRLLPTQETRDDRPSSTRQISVLREQSEAWWFAQLTHYGLPITLGREQAEESIKQAIMEDRLVVPQRLLDLENRLKSILTARSTQQAQASTGPVPTNTVVSAPVRNSANSGADRPKQMIKNVHLSLNGELTSSSSSSSNESDPANELEKTNISKTPLRTGSIGIQKGLGVAKSIGPSAQRKQKDKINEQGHFRPQSAAHLNISENAMARASSNAATQGLVERVKGTSEHRPSGRKVTPETGLNESSIIVNGAQNSCSGAFTTPKKPQTDRKRDCVGGFMSYNDTSSEASSDSDDESVIFQSSKSLKTEAVDDGDGGKKLRRDNSTPSKPGPQNTKMSKEPGRALKSKTKIPTGVTKHKKLVEISSDNDSDESGSEEATTMVKRRVSSSANHTKTRDRSLGRSVEDAVKHKSQTFKGLKDSKHSGSLSNVASVKKQAKEGVLKNRNSSALKMHTGRSGGDHGNIDPFVTGHDMREVNEIGVASNAKAAQQRKLSAKPRPLSNLVDSTDSDSTDPSSDPWSVRESVPPSDTSENLKAKARLGSVRTEHGRLDSGTISDGLQAALDHMPSYLRGHTRYDSPELLQSMSSLGRKTDKDEDRPQAGFQRSASAAPDRRKRRRPNTTRDKGQGERGSETKRPRLLESSNASASTNPDRMLRVVSGDKSQQVTSGQKAQKPMVTSNKGRKRSNAYKIG